MSIQVARIIFNPPKKKMIGSIAIDVFEKETYSRESSMTSFPIEDGSEISEHIVNMPKELSIEGFVGANDMSNPLNFTNNFITVFDQINQLIDSKQVVTVVMGLDIYDNMHIESFEVQRDRATSQGLPFTMKLKEAVIVTSQTVGIPSSKLTGPNGQQLMSDKNVGNGNNGQTQTQNQILDAYKQGNNLGHLK